METKYNNSVKTIIETQEQHIPYRTINSNFDPKWMTCKLRHMTGFKRIYKQMQKCETHLKNFYVELTRSVKTTTRTAMKNYKIKIARKTRDF